MTAAELHCGEGLYQCEVVIDLKEAGLIHARGKTDGCAGDKHRVPEAAVTIDLAAAGLIPADDLGDLGKVLQVLHEQAHPDGPLYWQNCPGHGCAEAADGEWDWS